MHGQRNVATHQFIGTTYRHLSKIFKELDSKFIIKNHDKIFNDFLFYSTTVSPHFFNSINTASSSLPFSVSWYSTRGGISG